MVAVSTGQEGGDGETYGWGEEAAAADAAVCAASSASATLDADDAEGRRALCSCPWYGRAKKWISTASSTIATCCEVAKM